MPFVRFYKFLALAQKGNIWVISNDAKKEFDEGKKMDANKHVYLQRSGWQHKENKKNPDLLLYLFLLSADSKYGAKLNHLEIAGPNKT